MRVSTLLVVILFISCCSRNSNSVETPVTSIQEAVSLFGEPLFRPEFDESTNERLTEDLRNAIQQFKDNPDDPQSIIWVGRRASYLWRFQDAIYIYSDGLRDNEENPRFYRHRGHRYITVREFDNAIRDLLIAAELIRNTDDEIELDGAPNSSNIPVSTLHFNVWYHLGVAYYLKGDYLNAEEAFSECLKVSVNDDLLVSTSDWMYMTLRRLGKHQAAEKLLEPITTEMNIIESHSYHRRLLMYKGEIQPDELLNSINGNELDLITQGYGVANWYFVEGNPSKAVEILNDIMKTGYWAAFGYIAAESDLAANRMRIN